MHRRNFLFTVPRSASHLIVRILNLEDQPSIMCGGRDGGYFFFDAQEKIAIEMSLKNDVRTWTIGERKSADEALRIAGDSLMQHINTAEQQGKDVFIKEHISWITDPVSISEFASQDGGCHGQRFNSGEHGPVSQLNNTLFPDAFVKTIHATFLIRHPARMVPSMARAMKDLGVSTEDMTLSSECTLHWSRRLYDWLVERKTAQGDHFPIILDAEDIISHPDCLIRYSKLAGLDPSRLKFEWEKKTHAQLEERTDEHRRMTNTLSASSGIVKNQDWDYDTFNLDALSKEWESEFGLELAEQVRAAVSASIDDYEYLRSRRLKPE